MNWQEWLAVGEMGGAVQSKVYADTGADFGADLGRFAFELALYGVKIRC